MDFSIPRSAMLRLLADAMDVSDARLPAFLGRFQHLQRLSLVEGINPGRGKAAEYKAHQVLVIALGLQMLQLGLTPERAVKVIKHNQDRVRLAISLAVYDPNTITPSIIWFDPAVLTRSMGEDETDDLADATFDYGGPGSGRDAFEWFFVEGFVQRMTFISVSGTLWHMVTAFEGAEVMNDKPAIGELSSQFLDSLRAWVVSAKPDSLS